MAECPFSWTTQEEGCVVKTKVWKPVQCRGAQCQLWSGANCVFQVMNERLGWLEAGAKR